MSKTPSGHREADPGIFERFVHSEVAGSVVLLACTIAALVWANSPWAESYFEILHTKIGLTWDDHRYALSVHHLINDALMVVFFFVVGLEIKRELVVGHLASMKKAVLPVTAAAGGMIAPAAIYVFLNVGGEGARGWGIPMATDIAFALGILAVFGKRVPVALKVFLAAAAIADDLGAVLVIALFYTETIRWSALAVAAGFLLLLFVVTRVLWIRRLEVLLPLILGVWAGVFASGVHATVAGILVAMLVPVRAEIQPGRFLQLADDRLKRLRSANLTTESMLFDQAQMDAIVDIRQASEELEPAGLSLEHRFHPIHAFFILPLFALANAGVVLDQSILATLSTPVGLGIVLGLVLGKQLGITGFSWLAIRSGFADLPEGVNWQQVYGAACLAGVGFTMSLFISDLAFASGPLLSEAKVGILVASLISAVWGVLVLQRGLPRRQG